jgi:hypothetical protein
MHNKQLEKLDFRSLRMLKILLDTGSVTKAGEALSPVSIEECKFAADSRGRV